MKNSLEIVLKKQETQILPDLSNILWNINLGVKAKLLLQGNRILGMSNLNKGDIGKLEIIQDNVGSRTLTLPSNSIVVGTTGAILTLSSTPLSIDIVDFYFNGTTIYWNLEGASGGGDPSIPGRVTALETDVSTLKNNEYKITYFAKILSGTAGTITIPTGATILLDQFQSGADAFINTIQNNEPTGKFPVDSAGNPLDITSFDAAGNYILTGTPSAYPIALIYIFKIKASNYSNIDINYQIDLQDVTNSPEFTTSINVTNIGTSTNTDDIVETIKNNSSNIPTDGFGVSKIVKLASSTTNNRDVGKELFYWVKAADALRQGGYKIQLVGTANIGVLQDAFRISMNGNSFQFDLVTHPTYDPKLSFYSGTFLKAFIVTTGDNIAYITVASSLSKHQFYAGSGSLALSISTSEITLEPGVDMKLGNLINLPIISTPASPSDGSIWREGTGLTDVKIRQGGTTRSFNLT